MALIALLLGAGIAALAAKGEIDPQRGLAGTIARRIVCAPHLPDACRHHPLIPAYGWPLARLARALAPPPLARRGPSGLPLVPVDFRRCRRQSCAVPRPGPAGTRLTVGNRRTTAFVALDDRRRSLGWVELTYWLYRPGLGWERVARRADRTAVAAAGDVRVLKRDSPPWSRWRPCPAATTTSSQPARNRPGAGRSSRVTPAGQVDNSLLLINFSIDSVDI